LQNRKDIEALRVKENIVISKDKYSTDIKLKEIDFQKDSTLAGMKYSSFEKQKEQDNRMLIAISILIFILIYIYLKYQKSLAQIEIEREKEYKNMLAKKEYAERILAIVASGNISTETEHKLLKILDEINRPTLPTANNGAMLHRFNSDIEKLPLQKNI
jgi:hypothetical protein